MFPEFMYYKFSRTRSPWYKLLFAICNFLAILCQNNYFVTLDNALKISVLESAVSESLNSRKLAYI